eukprot:CAMPEP_0172534728 /NCGR_PEP_ID=MMETSP1067-20121228/6991_1 /TAXON_ID=265564 ORGANISM="Thalassiosira punctigera, Strain Tpunct2005C2" /NCGR_SAMPLE_ID=MMETSP1067 /ASSEMBLY_ACC=CAM_ASM_000444 /LENGTH=289 /DNA_ID=CAMNT_0013319551 /DNA_START=46 /DNA_END=915 /DNA_ORIENTATION=+
MTAAAAMIQERSAMVASSPTGRITTHRFIARTLAAILLILPHSSALRTAPYHGRVLSVGHNSWLAPGRIPPSTPSVFKKKFGSSTSINMLRDHAQSSEDFVGLGVDEEQQSYPVQVRHQGHVATIFVRKDEPILQALERQSTLPTNPKARGENDETNGGKSSLALSHIPHECRRGNCLTCSSRIEETSETQNVLANVDNGLSPTVASELARSGYILTCCSFVTGPGVTLELDQNEQVWDIVYRKRICDTNSKQIATEAQARLLRRVDEENVGKWKRRMEEVWKRGDGDV